MTMSRPESEAQVQGMFDRIAGRYDLLNRLLSFQQDKRWRKVLVDNLPTASGSVHVDVACGTGDVLFAAAKARPQLDKIYGLDLSKEMLRLAEAKNAATELGDKVEWIHGSAERIPLPDQTTQSVSISFGLRNVVDRAAALREFHRITADRGLLLVLEFFQPPGTIMSKLFQFYFHKVLPLIGGVVSDWEAYQYLPKSVSSFYDADGFRTLLAKNGWLVRKEKAWLFGGCRLVVAEKRSLPPS